MSGDSQLLLCIFGSLVFMLQGVETIDIYVDSQNGANDASCGIFSKPCKSLDFAWNQYLTSSTSNTTRNVTFLLEPGVYNTDQINAQPLFYRCSNESVSRIDIKRNGKTKNTTESSVEIFYSFSISQCVFKLTGLTFKDNATLTTADASIHISGCQFIGNKILSVGLFHTDIIFDNVIFSNLSSANVITVLRPNKVIIQNSKFQHFKLGGIANPFIDIQSAEMVFLSNISIHRCFGPDELPYIRKMISVRDTTILQLKDIEINQNRRLGFQIENVPLITAEQLNMEDNVNVTLSFGNVLANVTGVILKSRFVNGGRPTISFTKSAVVFKDLVVSCESKKILEQSPISLDSRTTTKCDNCSLFNCRNICGAGYQMTQNVFCEKCAAGTSAHKWEKQCRSCHPGFYSPNDEAKDCYPCKAGSYCDKKGCTSCKKCTNDMFTSTEASVSCSQMSLLFIILLGVSLLFIMAPIAVKVIKTTTRSSEQKNEESDELEEPNQKYQKFENEEMVK